MPAPYRIADAVDGLFELQQVPDLPDPTIEEEALARAITGRLNWLRANPAECTRLGHPYAEGLKAVAQRGLAAEQDRDIAGATQDFTN